MTRSEADTTDLPPDMSLRRTDPAKMRRAAAHPQRPGRGCKAAPGEVAPVVDPARCEGKGECVQVCPYDVFEVGRIADADYRALPWLSRLKLRVHGMQTASTPRAELCQACGLCVVACPERAISLVELAARPDPPPTPGSKPLFL